MKCANPVCNRGIGLVAYQRGWFGKRRYCTKHCRDAFVADAPKPQRELNRSLVRRFVVASAGFAALVIPAAFTMAVLAAPSVRPAAPSMPGCDRDLAIASASVAAMHARVNSLAGIGRSETCKATQFLFLEVVKARAVTALCKSGSERERDLGRFDADVANINEAIATGCL